MNENLIQSQIPHVLNETDFSFLGEKYEGKVRDSYVQGDKRFLITTDRLSCFDVVVACVPFKGQVLNELAIHWFEQAKDIMPNHIIACPDPNVMVVRNCEILPVEVIVRGYITGSAWRDYEAGKAVSGIELPKGLRANQQLPEPILTPSTKAERGEHDEPISESEILSRGIVAEDLWNTVREKAFALFALGQEKALEQGLILVDTKYEFGLIDGELILADEIHTLDSSRYWVAESYQERFEAGESPVMLDKEPTRQWLLSQGYKGEGEIPTFTEDHLVSLSKHYMDSFEQIAGKSFTPFGGDVRSRIENNLREYLG